MGELDYRFTGAGGQKLRVALGAAGDPQLYRWADRAWWQSVPLYDSAYEVLRELAALAAARKECGESSPGGSRGFEAHGSRWRISFLRSNGFPQIFRLSSLGSWERIELEDQQRPGLDVLCREFAALGREQGVVQNAKEYSEAALRLIDERDRARDDARKTFRDLNAARERIAELEAQLAAETENCGPFPESRDVSVCGGAKFTISFSAVTRAPLVSYPAGAGVESRSLADIAQHLLAELLPHFAELAREQGEWSQRAYAASLASKLESSRAEAEAQLAAKDRELAGKLGWISELEQTERDSRAEVSSLLEALEGQKAKAEKWRLDSGRWLAAHNEQKARADGLVKVCVATTEAMNEEWSRAEAAEGRVADLESTFGARLAERMEGFAQGCVAAAKAIAGMPAPVEAGVTGDRYSFAAAEARFRSGDASVGQLLRESFQSGFSAGMRKFGEILDGEASDPGPKSYAADVPASALPDELVEALRQSVSDFRVFIPAHGEAVCSKCGFWAATEGWPEMPVCRKCDHSIEAERGA